ncbi:hypothetical protein FACS189479_04980 [Spirochaetia bacterium]|nr:hypothetical protein FACS189479_04980 [Spirochaetia bacterium]
MNAPECTALDLSKTVFDPVDMRPVSLLDRRSIPRIRSPPITGDALFSPALTITTGSEILVLTLANSYMNMILGEINV